jgi:hypothetical protein
MRSKIIAVNAGIVTVIAILTYVLLQTSLKDVVANPIERKKEVAQALRAASSQLALDARPGVAQFAPVRRGRGRHYEAAIGQPQPKVIVFRGLDGGERKGRKREFPCTFCF